MKKTHKGRILDIKDGVSVIDCSTCGFKHVQPLPSASELSELYEKDFFSKEKPNYIKNIKADFLWWQATYDNYYSLLEKQTHGRKLLDVGSGTGDFLACGKKRGWQVLGIEPSVVAAKYARSRKLPVVNDFFSSEALKERGPFDVVHAALVLEHVPDPAGFINDMKKLLTPKGLLAISCPNDYNPLQEILRQKMKFRPWWIVTRHHLNYFDAFSMKKLLIRLGLKPVELIGSFPMEFFLLSGVNYVGNDEVGRKCQKIRKTFELNMYKAAPETLNAVYSALLEQNIARSFFIIAQNK